MSRVGGWTGHFATDRPLVPVWTRAVVAGWTEVLRHTDGVWRNEEYDLV
jgi:hypothetical protein